MYIILEGIDGAGKSTQVELLDKWFKNKNINSEIIREPTDSRYGKIIREKLQRSDSTSDINQQILTLLFATDRLTLKQKIIDVKEKKDQILLSDRSFYSSIAYQDNSSIDTEWIYDVNRYTPRADLTILLDLDEKVAITRCDSEECFENTEFLRKTRKNYLDLIKKEENFIVIDATSDIESVQEKIQKVILEMLELDI